MSLPLQPKHALVSPANANDHAGVGGELFFTHASIWQAIGWHSADAMFSSLNLQAYPLKQAPIPLISKEDPSLSSY
jgi:hypothetical protein